VRRSRRWVRSVSSVGGVATMGFLVLEEEGLGSAHPKSISGADCSSTGDGVESTSSHCSTFDQPCSSDVEIEHLHSSRPSTKMT
jgi:hypothetical protein